MALGCHQGLCPLHDCIRFQGSSRSIQYARRDASRHESTSDLDLGLKHLTDSGFLLVGTHQGVPAKCSEQLGRFVVDWVTAKCCI